MKKRIVTLMLAAMLLLLAGCSGGGEESSSTALNVVVAATYVDDSMVEGLKTELATLTDYPDITISTVAMGDSEADPMGTMAGMAKLSGMMAAGEVDVLITDADNARRYGDNGESYIALSELFTEEELAAHGVNIVIYANQLTRSAFPAMRQTAEDILRYHRAKEVDDRLMPIKEIITLIDEL